MNGHNLPDFIRNVLLNELERMIYKEKVLYLGVGQVAIGIEFLGACHDAHPFNVERQSRARFKLGIDHYMARVNARYPSVNIKNTPQDLYTNLRCGMAHIVRPQGVVGVIDRGNGLSKGMQHLETFAGTGQLIVFPETLFDDLAKACELLIKDLPSMPNPKLRGVFLPVTEIT
jgi:hypothetical protein